MAMKVGLLGGTFNPIHFGHLAIATFAREAFELDRVMFIPAGQPPHKAREGMAPAHDRYQMTVLATHGDSHLAVSPVEMERRGKSYSVETVAEMQGLFGDAAQLFFIVGTDAMVDIVNWERADELVKMCEFIVASRPGTDLRKVAQKYRRRIHVLKAPVFGIASTDIRQRVREGRSVRYLVPELVERYIAGHRLYLGKGRGDLAGGKAK